MRVRPKKVKDRYGFWIEELFNFPAFAYPAVDLELSDRRFTWLPDEPGYAPEGKPGAWYWFAQDYEVEVSWEARQNALLMFLKITNLSNLPLKINTIDPARITIDPVLLKKPEHLSIFQNGFQSWSPTRFRKATDSMQFPRIRSFGEMNHYTDSRFWKRRDGLLSNQFLVLKEQSALDSGVFGFLTQKAGLGEIFWQATESGQLICSLDYGGKELLPEQSLRTEALYMASDYWPEAVEKYADAVGEAMSARIPDRPVVGWSSWYQYTTKISQSEMVANTLIAESHPEFGIEYMQLDDGYQTAVGDWLSLNRTFPGSLASLAETISSHGLKPGIWVAPFMASTRSNLYREQPQWFLRDAKGKTIDCGFNPNWRGRPRALDLTHPDLQDWMHNLFAALREAGFEFFKLDFLFAGVRKGSRFNPEQSPLESYRTGLQIIRESVGEDAYILGCGAPLGGSIGLVDSMRISADVKEVWEPRIFRFLGRGCDIPSLKDSLRNNLTRSFLNRRWWVNDPDCLVVREKNSHLSEAEVQLLLTVVGLSGGNIFLGDALAQLTPARAAWIQRILPPSELTGKPVFPEEEAFAERVILQRHYLRLEAHINWSNKRVLVEFQHTADHEMGYAFDFWEGKMVSTNHPVSIRPHGVRLLIQPTEEIGAIPRLVGNNFHLAGAVDGRLQTKFKANTSMLTIHAKNILSISGKVAIELPGELTLDETDLPQTVLGVEPWARGFIFAIQAPAPWNIKLQLKRKI